MWNSEKEHLNIMERLCAKYDVSPTRLTPILSVIAFTLGNYCL